MLNTICDAVFLYTHNFRTIHKNSFKRLTPTFLHKYPGGSHRRFYTNILVADTLVSPFKNYPDCANGFSSDFVASVAIIHIFSVLYCSFGLFIPLII